MSSSSPDWYHKLSYVQYLVCSLQRLHFPGSISYPQCSFEAHSNILYTTLNEIRMTVCVYCCSLCVYCCSYFRCRTAGQKSVSGRSCDRPPRHRFFLFSLCIQAKAEMVPKFPSCCYMPLMQPSRLKFPRYFFFFIFVYM